MSDWITADLTDEVLHGICPECNKHGVRHASGLLAVRCEHSERAAWRAPGGAWHLVPPVGKEIFKLAIATGIVKAELLAGVLEVKPDLQS